MCLFYLARCHWRSDPPRLVDTPPIKSFEQGLKLGCAQPHHAVAHSRPTELAILQPFGDEHHAGAVPEDQLYPVRPLRPKHIDDARERVGAYRLPHQRRQALGTFAEVDRLRCHHHSDIAGGADHENFFSARITAATVDARAPWPTRMVTPPISSSIAAVAALFRDLVAISGSARSTTAGTKPGKRSVLRAV